jgi:hypothetical protein
MQRDFVGHNEPAAKQTMGLRGNQSYLRTERGKDMTPFGIIGAIFGAPSAIEDTLSLVKALTSHGAITSLIANSPVTSAEIASITNAFSQVETDVANIRKDGFFSKTFFEDSERIAIDATSATVRLLAIVRDPSIIKQMLQDPPLQALIAEMYATAKMDLALLSSFDISIPIPNAMASTTSTFTGTHQFTNVVSSQAILPTPVILSPSVVVENPTISSSDSSSGFQSGGTTVETLGE